MYQLIPIIPIIKFCPFLDGLHVKPEDTRFGLPNDIFIMNVVDVFHIQILLFAKMSTVSYLF